MKLKFKVHPYQTHAVDCLADCFAGQPKVSDMMRGDFSNLSERKLMDCLNRLGYDIEIKVKPASNPVGHLMLAIA